MRRRLVLSIALALVAALAAAAAASADVVTRTDTQGRTITFDVRDATADVDWYTTVLRNAVHGNEITGVTIRIVPEQEIRSYCGAGAAACWSGRRGTSTITVPTGRDDSTASVLLHEYGHHLDNSWSVTGVQELNGTPAWWAARGMASLLTQGSVAFDYSLGWSHSVGEIFAEDYAYLHLPYRYSIEWLTPPDESLRAALLSELGGTPTTPAPQPQPQPQPPPGTPKPPVVVTRAGRVAPGAQRTIPFELLGPGRRVTVTATIYGVRGRSSGVTLSIVCNGARVASTPASGRSRTTLDRRGLGPARCETALANGGGTARRYVITLRLALEPAS